MIRTLLIDDERLALLQLEKLLTRVASLDIVGAFTEPLKAIEAASQLELDVIFLDIDMPEINGMQAAEMIQEVCPSANIVFVTAYNEYALEAFELNALDYILKPVQRDRLSKTISRLEEKLTPSTEKLSKDQAVTIRCCQSFRIERDGNTPQSLRWRTAKAQELFAFLLHNRNRFVSKDLLIDMLWPDFDHKKASTHLYTTVYQVRQCLKQADVNMKISNVSGGEGYTLSPENVLIDVEQWENRIRELSSLEENNCEEHLNLVELYTGDYLGDYDYMWAESERQRLRTIWLHHAMKVADFHTTNNSIASAVTVYQRIIQLEPYYEEGHLGLMKLYDYMGERAAVDEQYRILSNLLNKELGISLSATTEDWFEQWNLEQHRSI